MVGVKLLRREEEVMLITEKGMIIRLDTAEISTIGRNTQGVRLIQLEEGDHLVSVARLAERDADEATGTAAAGGGRPSEAGNGDEEDGDEESVARPWPPLRWPCWVSPAAARKASSTSTSTRVKAKDNQTLSSFAAVPSTRRSTRWKITKIGDEQQARPRPSPSWPAKVKEIEAQIGENKKDARLPWTRRKA